MGVFFDRPAITNVAITTAISDALKQDPAAVDVPSESAKRADELQAGGGGFKAGRFMIALAILIVFVAAAIGTDAAGVDDSSKALYGFATTIMGVIVGLLAGEKTATS